MTPARSTTPCQLQTSTPRPAGASSTSFNSPNSPFSTSTLSENDIVDIILREGARSEGPRVRIFDTEDALYERIKARVNAQNEHLRYYYDTIEKITVIETLASHAHESLQFYLTQDLRSSLQEWVRKIVPKAIVDIAGTVRHDLYDAQGIRLKGKTPDQGFRILVPPRYKSRGHTRISSLKLATAKATAISVMMHVAGFAEPMTALYFVLLYFLSRSRLRTKIFWLPTNGRHFWKCMSGMCTHTRPTII